MRKNIQDTIIKKPINMKFKYLSIIIALIFFIASCEKEEFETFEHQEVKLELESICDSLVQVIPGAYTGNYILHHPFSDDDPDTSVVTMNVTHVVTSTNYIQDSLSCTFHCENILNSNVIMNDYSGQCTNSSLRFYIDSNKVVLRRYVYYPESYNSPIIIAHLNSEFIAYK